MGQILLTILSIGFLMIALFAIAIVGLVAIEGRSVEAQRSSALMRDAERAAFGDVGTVGFEHRHD